MGLDWRMCACRLAVAAADARKAEDASDTTERTPRPPYLVAAISRGETGLQLLPLRQVNIADPTSGRSKQLIEPFEQ